MASECAIVDNKAPLFAVPDCPTSAAFVASSYWPMSAAGRRKQREALANAVPRGINGELYTQLQRRHRTGALNLRVLRHHGCLGAFDESSRLAIIAHERAHRLSMLNLCVQERRLTHLFSAAGITTRLLKGPRLSQWLYGDPCLRHSKDLDYWVPPHEARHAIDLLLDQGFRLHERDQRFLQRWPELILDGYELELLPPKGRYSVEVHWRIESASRALYEPHWQHVLDNDGRDGEFLYLLWHGARHRWARLKWLADIVGWLDQDPDIVERTRGTQRRLRLENTLTDCLAVLRDVGLHDQLMPSTEAPRPRSRVTRQEATRYVRHREAIPEGLGEFLRYHRYHLWLDARLPIQERAAKLIRSCTRPRWVFTYVPLPRSLPLFVALSPAIVAIRNGFKAVQMMWRWLGQRAAR